MDVVKTDNIHQVWDDTNEQLAIAFRQLIENQTERGHLLKEYPELKNAMAFYERGVSNFCKRPSLSKKGQVILTALKENVCFQIQEEGPESFGAMT